MVLTASLCDTPIINEFELGKKTRVHMPWVAPDYAAGLTIGPWPKRKRSAYMWGTNYLLIIIIYTSNMSKNNTFNEF